MRGSQGVTNRAGLAVASLALLGSLGAVAPQPAPASASAVPTISTVAAPSPARPPPPFLSSPRG
jgi:hypothetical protein